MTPINESAFLWCAGTPEQPFFSTMLEPHINSVFLTSSMGLPSCTTYKNALGFGLVHLPYAANILQCVGVDELAQSHTPIIWIMFK